jgi:uncharacterized protein
MCIGGTYLNKGITVNCPTCNVELRLAERSGVEIDYCPQCRGVWLDRGELDKIIERSAPMAPAAAMPQQGTPLGAYDTRRGHDDDDDDDHDDHDRRGGLFGLGRRRGHRGGLLDDLFDR